MIGKVTKIQKKKRMLSQLGYGYITNEDGEQYYFILADTTWVELGMTVFFKGEKNEKGNLAVQIRPIT